MPGAGKQILESKPVMLPFLAFPIAFLCGSMPTALVMGKLKGIDITKHGSGNIGATNAFRVLGKSWGIACLVIDALKGYLPAMAFGVGWFIGRTLPAGALIAVAGLGARTALLASVENAVLGQLRNHLVNEKEMRDERR